MTKLNIITPCSRPENLEDVELSIYTAILHSFPYTLSNIRWIVVMDGVNKPEINIELAEFHYLESGELGISGNPQRNYALDIINDGYVYFLDDDNKIHHQFIKYYRSFISSYPDHGFIVNQLNNDGSIRLYAPDIPSVGNVDTAQFLLTREMIGDVRWDPFNYCADGKFISDIHKIYGDKIIKVNRNLSYYNELRYDN